MIDMHIHTIFSDGEINNIEKIIKYCNIISITDHNSIEFYNSFKNKFIDKKIIVGCEITIDQSPDYLVYFPDIKYFESIEKCLKNIRLTEESVIKECYYNLGYTEWERDISLAYKKNQKIKNARTRDLAAIIHLYKNNLNYDNGKFDFEDLEIARKQRSMYAKHIGNPIDKNIAFDIAKKYNGNIVLAHPIHTAIKYCKKDSINITSIKKELYLLIKKFISLGGKYIEFEYFSLENLNKYNISTIDINILEYTIIKISNIYNLNFTIGTDSHSLEKYNQTLEWTKKSINTIYDRLAKWIIYNNI